MSIREAYKYWYRTARLVFNHRAKHLGIDIAVRMTYEHYSMALWFRDSLKADGNPTWRYQHARAMAYLCVYHLRKHEFRL